MECRLGVMLPERMLIVVSRRKTLRFTSLCGAITENLWRGELYFERVNHRALSAILTGLMA
ncbi:hypothetical protein QNH14_14100 [Apirhabdus apintestini]|nr:hypothetical protein QNH14_14100 [Enterobacteriaceae bacterium CA-0114]